MQQLQAIKIGILGGGQLGRMLLQKAIDLDLHISVLDPDEDAPCRHICKEFFHGSFTDYDAVYNFGKQFNLVTIEIENVNVEALERLEKEGIKVHPSSAVIKTVQDKGLQKEFYKKHNFPTAEFVLVKNRAEISEHASLLPMMHKSRKGGYDGKGVFVLKKSADIENAADVPAVLEHLIDFEKEISVIVARNENGEVRSFPVVDMSFNQEANLVEYLYSPSSVSEQLEKEATSLALKIAESLSLVGILAVEMFVTKDGKLLINEIAPRPHNSGHQTIEGNITSQYEQMLRAITNLPLGETTITKPAVMVNILGEKGFEGKAIYSGLEEVLKKDGVHIHLYGKKLTKPFRKMGHVTVTSNTLSEAIEKANYIKNTLKVIA
ncbi:MAG: 5-(carboxyamino)imidazole ribonucleotide synthase [Bacteroidota bacterium]